MHKGTIAAMAFCLLAASPASIDIECGAIRDPNVCVKKRPHCGWPEVNWGRRGPPAPVYDAFGVRGRIRGEYCDQASDWSSRRKPITVHRTRRWLALWPWRVSPVPSLKTTVTTQIWGLYELSVTT
jgi:hypothetical protein